MRGKEVSTTVLQGLRGGENVFCGMGLKEKPELLSCSFLSFPFILVLAHCPNNGAGLAEVGQQMLLRAEMLTSKSVMLEPSTN